jgi:hypothetical protein
LTGEDEVVVVVGGFGGGDWDRCLVVPGFIVYLEPAAEPEPDASALGVGDRERLSAIVVEYIE